MPPIINGQMGQGPGAVNPAMFGGAGNPSQNTMPNPFGTTPPQGGGMGQNPFGTNTGSGAFGIQNPVGSTFQPNQPNPSASMPQSMLQPAMGVAGAMGRAQSAASQAGMPLMNPTGQQITGGGQQFRSTSGMPGQSPSPLMGGSPMGGSQPQGQSMQPGGQGGMAPPAQPQQFGALAQNTSQSPGAQSPPGSPQSPPGYPSLTQNSATGQMQPGGNSLGAFSANNLPGTDYGQAGRGQIPDGKGGYMASGPAQGENSTPYNPFQSQQNMDNFNAANPNGTSANPTNWWNQPQMQQQGQPWSQPQQAGGSGVRPGLGGQGHLGALGMNAGQPSGGGQIGGARMINGRTMLTPGLRR